MPWSFFRHIKRRKILNILIALRIIIQEGDLNNPIHYDKAISDLAELTYLVAGIDGMNYVQKYFDTRDNVLFERSKNNAE